MLFVSPKNRLENEEVRKNKGGCWELSITDQFESGSKRREEEKRLEEREADGNEREDKASLLYDFYSF